MKQQLLIKRHGMLEEYDERKVYASVYAASLNAHLTEQEAEALAAKTATAVQKALTHKDAVTSKDIKDAVVQALGGPSSDVAYLYLHHLDIN